MKTHPSTLPLPYIMNSGGPFKSTETNPRTPITYPALAFFFRPVHPSAPSAILCWDDFHVWRKRSIVKEIIRIWLDISRTQLCLLAYMFSYYVACKIRKWIVRFVQRSCARWLLACMMPKIGEMTNTFETICIESSKGGKVQGSKGPNLLPPLAACWEGLSLALVSFCHMA